MTKTTTNLIGIIITILAGTYFYITCCSECGTAVKEEPTKEVLIPPVPEATSYPFTFSNGDFAYSIDDNYNFNVSSSSFLTPLPQGIIDGITKLKAYLTDNTGKAINITGYYKSDEVNNTAFPNLGLARANRIKNHFVENGISSARINTYGKLMDEIVAKDNVYLGPAMYGLEDESVETADALKALYERITANPLVLHFDTAEASINLTSEQRQKFADISRYLDKVDGAVANVVGHADNTGEPDTNIRLAQERADFAKAYLMRNGIPESRISASSKGSDEPVASNSTEEGKAQNRRAVVTLK